MTNNDNSFPIFHYKKSDFHFRLNKISNDAEELSKFDVAIIEKWNEAETNNVLRYKLNISKWKRIEGKYKYLAQLNIDRSKNRRQPEEIKSMKMPFDSNRFNFTKISKKEVYFDICTGDGNNILAVNVSPLEFGHCLFLPERLKCLPQIVTKFSLLKTIELLLLSKSPYFRAAFNSLCAHASVNHLHWHFYYLKHKMLLESLDLHQLSDYLYTTDNNYSAKGFCLKLSTFRNNLELFAEKGYKILNYLQNNEIAHNIYITRAKSSLNHDEEEIYDDLRMYIWPRTSNIQMKSSMEFPIACCELFGHLVIRNEEIYGNLTESFVDSLLKNVTSDIFHELKNDIITLSIE